MESCRPLKKAVPKNDDVKERYPRGYDSSQLESMIDDYADKAIGAPGVEPSHFLKATLGLTELQRRSASIFGWASLSISVLALLVSVLSAYYTYATFKTTDDDSHWKNYVVALLHKIENTAQKSDQNR